MKSFIPPDGVHRKPCNNPSPAFVIVLPTIQPRLLIASAELSLPPRVPRSLIPPDEVQEKACRAPCELGVCPTSVPESLTANTSVPDEPTFCIPSAWLHVNPKVFVLPFGK